MKVLVASKEPSVLDIVKRADEAIPALATGRIYEHILEAQLAIVDYSDLVARPFSVGLIHKLLEDASLEQCSSAEFLAEPDSYLNRRASRPRTYKLPEQRVIAFTSYSGGTGKTSLSLATALRFAEKTRDRQLPLPVALLEFTYGGSAIQSLTGGTPLGGTPLGDGQPLLDELVAQPELSPFNLHGVTLYPMQYDRLDLGSRQRIGRYLHEQISHHVLTVLDTSWPHGLVLDIGSEVDLWVVLATPRIDAVENARQLRGELATQYGENRVALVVNQMGGLTASLALMGTQRVLEIPQLKQDQVFFEARPGRDILRHVYNSVWQDYERGGLSRGLFRRRR